MAGLCALYNLAGRLGFHSCRASWDIIDGGYRWVFRTAEESRGARLNNLINSVLNWFKARPLVSSIAVGFLILLVGLLLWFYGARAVNGISNWWYSRGTEAAHEEIDKLKVEASAAKAIAEEALRELALEKERGAIEKEKREIAEGILNDRRLTTDQKLKAYEEALRGAPTVSAPASVDELCARAAAAGIKCE